MEEDSKGKKNERMGMSSVEQIAEVKAIKKLSDNKEVKAVCDVLLEHLTSCAKGALGFQADNGANIHESPELLTGGRGRL